MDVDPSDMTCMFKSIRDRIDQKIPATSFACDILNEKGIFSVVSDIESLANTVNVVLDKDGHPMTKDFKPGDVIGLEAKVAFENGELQVIEKVMCTFIFLEYIHLNIG